MCTTRETMYLHILESCWIFEPHRQDVLALLEKCPESLSKYKTSHLNNRVFCTCVKDFELVIVQFIHHILYTVHVIDSQENTYQEHRDCLFQIQCRKMATFYFFPIPLLLILMCFYQIFCRRLEMKILYRWTWYENLLI